MTALLRVCLMLSLAALACTRPGVTPPPNGVAEVAVLPPHNRTPDALLVWGTSFLEYALGSERVTVADVLAAELRAGLVRRGVAVTPPEAVETSTAGRVPHRPEAAVEMARTGGLGGSVLYTEIVRWESDGGTHPAFVIAAVRATLLDTQTGAVVWRGQRPAAPIPTSGAVTVGTAYVIAAKKVAEELLAAWSQP